MTLSVFFPSLMGVGIIVSGALLMFDWLRRLFPRGQIRRRHSVAVGAFGAVTDAIAAAGYRLIEPSFLHRGFRRRRTYLLIATTAVVVAAAAIWAGLALYNDPKGLFFRSPWVIGIGYGVGTAAVLAALLMMAIALWHTRSPGWLRRLVEKTSLGRYVLPSSRDNIRALSTVERM